MHKKWMSVSNDSIRKVILTIFHVFGQSDRNLLNISLSRGCFSLVRTQNRIKIHCIIIGGHLHLKMMWLLLLFILNRSNPNYMIIFSPVQNTPRVYFDGLFSTYTLELYSIPNSSLVCWKISKPSLVF